MQEPITAFCYDLTSSESIYTRAAKSLGRCLKLLPGPCSSGMLHDAGEIHHQCSRTRVLPDFNRMEFAVVSLHLQPVELSAFMMESSSTDAALPFWNPATHGATIFSYGS